MKLLCVLSLLLLNSRNLVSSSTMFETDLTLEELKKLNATCPSDNTCNGDNLDNSSMTCNCEVFCAQIGTCCVASPHIFVPGPKLKPTCQNRGYLMIDKCPKSSSPYEDLCNEERVEENDLMRLAPVTSLYTHFTYKNFFCFLCHESNDDYLFWNIFITGNGETDGKIDNGKIQLAYDEYYETWVAPIGKGGSFEPVNLNFAVPVNIANLARSCSPSLIADCSPNWPEDDARAKCHAYMHVTYIKKDGGKTLKFKNPHCALCNYQSLYNTFCPSPMSVPASESGGERPFSFSFLLDVNLSDGDKVGKIERCRGNNVWDPFFKKCRALQCAIVGHILQDGKCVRP